VSRITLRALLHGNGEQTLQHAVQRWCTGTVPGSRDEQLRACTSAMEHEERVLSRLQELPGKLQDLLETFLEQPGTVRTVQDLFQSYGRNFKSRFDLEASLAALQREGFLFPARDKRWASFDSPCWAVPGELADTVIGFRRRQQSSLKDSITLHGFLQARYFRERAGEDAEKISDHARKIYKLYLMPGSIDGRVQRLPAAARRAVELALVRHGGLCSHKELQRDLGDDCADLPSMRRWLEESMLGTAGPLELARLGVQSVPEAVVVFHEVALHLIQRHASANPPEVEQALCCGVNLGSNVGRFLRELGRAKVQFTVDGTLFKASCKRIASLLLPVPGTVLDPEEQLELVYRFCLHRRLIDRRGERVLGVTQQGHDFERSELPDQQRALLAWCVEDRSLPGEHFHQVRLRRVLLRLLRRAEPEQWQELQFLPFLARNTYLSQLDTQQAEGYFAARFQGGSYVPGETLQQLCWHLLVWVKKRLYPLGLVDVGLREGRPTALRLSRLGACLLEAEPAGKVGGVRSQVIVNPDFEVLVYPGDDVHEVVHAFDKFARRLKSDHVHQFKLELETVRQALRDGLRIDAIVRELTDRSRTAIPQNVLYTLAEWGNKA
jgi:hypothetical protein